MVPTFPFAEAIRVAPEDDAARLAAADWLRENGRPEQAEFVSLQCEWLRTSVTDPRAIDLRLRSAELLRDHEPSWLGEWESLLVRWNWRGGFLDSAVMTAETFLDHGERFFRQHPVRHLAIVSPAGEPLPAEAVAEVVRCPWFSSVRGLDATGCGDDGIYDDCGCFLAYHPGAAWCRELARAKHVTQLRRLALSARMGDDQPGTTTEAFAELAAAPHLHGLEHLDLDHPHGTGVGDDLAPLIANATWATSLVSLNLLGTDLSNVGASHLARAKFGRLQRLDLGECHRIGESGLSELLGSRGTRSLHDLGVAIHNGLFRALNEAPGLRKLRTLRLRNCHYALEDPVQPTTLRQLTRNPAFQVRWVVEDFPSTMLLTEALPVPLPDRWKGDRSLPKDLWKAGAIRIDPDERGLAVTVRDRDEFDRLSRWRGFRLATRLRLEPSFHPRPDPLADFLASPDLPPALSELFVVAGDGGTDTALSKIGKNPRMTTLARLAVREEAGTASGRKQLGCDLPCLSGLRSLWSVSAKSLAALKHRPNPLPRLTDVVVDRACREPSFRSLRKRLGPRLRVFASGY